VGRDVPDIGRPAGQRIGLLYSISAMTTYGHSNLDLEARWQMMGALEALNGMLLFDLTTAFLFAIIQLVSPLPRNERSRGRRMHPKDVA
jgi:hypothetical protein